MKFKKIHGVKTGRTRKQKVKNKNINVSEDLRLSVKSAVENEAKSGIEVSKKCCAGLDCKVLHRKKKTLLLLKRQLSEIPRRRRNFAGGKSCGGMEKRSVEVWPLFGFRIKKHLTQRTRSPR